MATSETNFVSALGVGSGIDTKSISKALAEAEIAPRQMAIERKLDDADRRVAGFSALTLAIGELKQKFDALKDKSSFASVSGSSSNASVASVAVSGAASPGRYELENVVLATEQRTVSGNFSSATQTLNSGNSFTLSFAFGSGDTTIVSINAAASNPQGVVDAINDQNIGVSAVLLNNGDASNPYQILLSGSTGADNSFTVATDDSSNPGVAVADLSLTTTLQNAGDASLTYQGISVTRESNTIADLIPGASVSLLAATSAGEKVAINLATNISETKSKFVDLVDQYNQTMSDIGVLMGDRSEDEEDLYSGSLQADPVARRIRNELRAMLTGDSSSPSGGLTAFWQLGLNIDRNGVASINEATLEGKLQSSLADVRKLFSADTDNQSAFSTDAAGIAGDASKTLGQYISYRGILPLNETSARTKSADLTERLEALEAKLEKIQQRYLRQFAYMDQAVAWSSSVSSSIVSSIGKGGG
ncbi:MAG: flagellar filament capping protein FliD [Proteobacteria bacterium]|nr:flagellar filament capping protein FliD [Pseudomonadota bacterium]